MMRSPARSSPPACARMIARGSCHSPRNTPTSSRATSPTSPISAGARVARSRPPLSSASSRRGSSGRIWMSPARHTSAARTRAAPGGRRLCLRTFSSTVPDAEQQVEFFVLEDLSGGARLRCACRIVEKAYLASQRVLVWHTDPEELRAFDELLWTFADRSFVPHEMLGTGTPEAPVL